MLVDGSLLEERIEIELEAGVWTDVSMDAFEQYQFDNGIRGTDIVRRTASPGSFDFVLNNSARNSAGLAGYYTPGHTNARAGFVLGAGVRMAYVYEGITYYKWRGKIDDIQPSAGFPHQRTRVICKNFIRNLQNVMELPVMVANKTAADGVQEVLNKLAVSPADTDLGSCAVTFDAIFDVIKRDSSGLREISRLILGEMGWFFVRGDQTSGEVVTVQGRNARAAKVTPVVPKGAARSGFLLLENGGYFLLENGGRLILNRTETLSLTPRAMNPPGMSAIYNEIVVKTYPRREDSSVVVLYVHPRSIELAPGETLAFSVAYADPEQLAQSVTAAFVSPLVEGIDYAANSSADGEGDDKTSLLEVTVLPGVAAADVTLTNLDGAETIHASLQIRGRGRYAYQAVEAIARDAASIALYGRQRLEIDTSYVSDPAAGKVLAEAILAATKLPKEEVSVLYLEPLMDSQNFFAFLFLEPGERLPIEDESAGIDDDYFVQHFTVSRSENGDLAVVYTLLSERLSTI